MTDGPRPRRSRRVDAPGTGPAGADATEPRLELALEPKPGDGQGGAEGRATENTGERDKPPALSERDRWLLEQRPPHWS
ncbi:MAG: hypothetical protein ACTHZ5_08645 [Micrococcaceae bacterium]